MNAYTVFLSPRLKVGSASEEAAKDKGKLEDQGMRELFGKDLVPKLCFSTAKLTTGLQYTEGQEVTINAHNQVANFTVEYTDDEKVMGFSRHTHGIRWKILAILWCDKPNKMASAGEPVFLLWSEHITEWENRDATNITYVHVAYRLAGWLAGNRLFIQKQRRGY